MPTATRTRSRSSSGRSLARTEVTPPPRFATPRTPSRPTLGGRVADIAEALGTPLMPWQRHVVNVALELDPATGLLVYRTVLVSVPRQSGKTTLGLAVKVHRALAFGSPQRIVYSAQTRNDARRKWEDDHVVRLEASPLAPLFTVRKSNGSEAIKWANGSLHGIMSTTDKAGHGETVDLAFVDEAFALVDDRLEQALRPAMITRPQPQLWIVSTAGTDDSHFLNAKQERGRQVVADGIIEDFAYFEWSAPEQSRLDDPGVWAGFHPAAGLTIDPETLAADALAMTRGEAHRAYFNWRKAGHTHDPVFGDGVWEALTDKSAPDISGSLVFGLAVTRDRTQTAIGVAHRRGDGFTQLEVAEARSGTDWVVDWLVERCDRWSAASVAIDPGGPAGSLLAELEQAGVPVVAMSPRQYAAACGALFDKVRQGVIRHPGDGLLNAAVSGVVRRSFKDSWMWDRRTSEVDICSLEAVTLALGSLLEPSAEEPKPVFAF
jgi:phage terminase large subunit-like protein